MQNRTTFGVAPTQQARAQQLSASELIGALKRWWSVYKAWRSEQTAIVELASLSDRDLRDIGLHRSEIACAVRDPSPYGGGTRPPAQSRR